MHETLELRSRVTEAGEIVLSLEETRIGPVGPDDVVVKVEAAPINPSDLGLLLGPADLGRIEREGTAERPVVRLPVPEVRRAALASRLGQSMTVGNEGAGQVVEAGERVGHLLGKTVSMFGGGMYANYRLLPAKDCMELPEGASAMDGASAFVNPMTCLAMVETLRREGHTALVHTAAASNLGQMLNRVCRSDGVPLVNVVRSPEQVALLRQAAASHVVDSSSPDFKRELTEAVAETGATLAFDAVGGGDLANTILRAMEAAASRRSPGYSRYGTSTFKQVYTYGSLDTGPTMIDRSYGMWWGIGGFLVMAFLDKAGADVTARLRDRVRRELKTTFASQYTDTLSLAGALDPDAIAAYARKATGRKFLINPAR